MNEPNDGSFQAGEPNRDDVIPVIVPISAARATEEKPPTWLDRVVLRVRAYERWGIIAALALQLGVLIAMMFRGTFKMVGGF